MRIGPPGTNRAGMNEEQDPRGRQVLPDARNKHSVPNRPPLLRSRFAGPGDWECVVWERRLASMSRRGTRRAGWLAEDRRCDRNDGHTVDALALDADEGRGHATKCSGEALAAGDPEMSEWGNPAGVMACHPEVTGGEPGELKHLSTPRKREDALSSGERTGQSPNRIGSRAGMRCRSGVVRSRWRGIPTPRWDRGPSDEAYWNGAPEGVRVP